MGDERTRTPEEERRLHTQASIARDLRALGLASGQTVIVHCSLKAMGRICGGPVAVILALEEVLGSQGTLAMPTMTLDLCDPSEPENRHPEAEWETVREHLPFFHPDLSPATAMGIVAETFRKRDGALRSSHPHLSFVARGARAREVVEGHSFHHALGEDSPLGRLYDLGAQIVTLGAAKDTNTTIHLAEYRQDPRLRGRKDWQAPVLVDGAKVWRTYHDVANSDTDFPEIHEAFSRETGLVRSGRVGDADSCLMPARDLVDFAVGWMNENRKAPDLSS